MSRSANIKSVLLASAAVILLVCMYIPAVGSTTWRVQRALGNDPGLVAFDAARFLTIGVAVGLAVWAALCKRRLGHPRAALLVRDLLRTAMVLFVGIVVSLALKLPPVTLSVEHIDRPPSGRNCCVNNLRQIDGAKEQWAMATGAKPDATPTPDDLDPYIKGGLANCRCPEGGEYTINALDTEPTCSLRDVPQRKTRVTLFLWQVYPHSRGHCL